MAQPQNQENGRAVIIDDPPSELTREQEIESRKIISKWYKEVFKPWLNRNIKQ